MTWALASVILGVGMPIGAWTWTRGDQRLKPAPWGWATTQSISGFSSSTA